MIKSKAQITELPLVSSIIGRGSSHLNGRDRAVARLQETVAPSRRTEAFKYTPIAKFLKQELAFGTAKSLSSPVHKSRKGACTLVFINGEFAAEHSDQIPETPGVTVGTLKQHAGNPLVEQFGDTTADSERFLSHMNAAAPSDGLFLAVDKGIAVPHSFQVVHYTIGDNINQPRDLIILGDNSSAELFFEQHAIDASAAFVNHHRHSVLGNGARLTVHRLQLEQSGSFHSCFDGATLESNAYFDIDTTTLDGGVLRNDIRVELNGQGAHAQLNGVYMLKNKSHVDNHTYIGHNVPDCTSDELYKGIVADSGTAVFNGKVFVAQDAQRTRAYQSNQNILTSDTANVYTKPELEIYADDVRCSHGCTIGRMDDDALFYLRSRGLSEKEATRLLTLAFCDDVLERITNEDWREQLSVLLQRDS